MKKTCKKHPRTIYHVFTLSRITNNNPRNFALATPNISSSMERGAALSRAKRGRDETRGGGPIVRGVEALLRCDNWGSRLWTCNQCSAWKEREAYDTPLCKRARRLRRRRRRRGVESFERRRKRRGEGGEEVERGGFVWLWKLEREGALLLLLLEEYEGSWHIELAPRILISRVGGGERKGREGGREVDRLATNLPMFEGEKKGGKKERQRERKREREIWVSQPPPTPCFASTRKRYRRALPMKVMVNNTGTECYWLWLCVRSFFFFL